MAYRDDVSALEARLAALSAELTVRVRERDEAARLLDEARARANAEAYLADLAAGGPARRRKRRIRIAAMVAGLAMIIGGLFAYHLRPHRDRRFDDAMAKFEQFTNDMCQCRDNACAQHVADDMTKWGTALAKQWPQPKLDETQTKRANDMAMRMAKCMQHAMAPPADQIAR